jgi:hypothetical protein
MVALERELRRATADATEAIPAAEPGASADAQRF